MNHRFISATLAILTLTLLNSCVSRPGGTPSAHQPEHQVPWIFGPSVGDTSDDIKLFPIYYQKRDREGYLFSWALFPLFRWYTKGEAWDFAFLWRLYHFKKDRTGKTRGHILFIPWGG